jgi:hypothetical protein
LLPGHGASGPLDWRNWHRFPSVVQLTDSQVLEYQLIENGLHCAPRWNGIVVRDHSNVSGKLSDVTIVNNSVDLALGSGADASIGGIDVAGAHFSGEARSLTTVSNSVAFKLGWFGRAHIGGISEKLNAKRVNVKQLSEHSE